MLKGAYSYLPLMWLLEGNPFLLTFYFLKKIFLTYQTIEISHNICKEIIMLLPCYGREPKHANEEIQSYGFLSSSRLASLKHTCGVSSYQQICSKMHALIYTSYAVYMNYVCQGDHKL